MWGQTIPLWLMNSLTHTLATHVIQRARMISTTCPGERGGGGGGGGGLLTIFWVTGRLGPFDPPFSTYVEFWPLLLGSDVEYWPPFFKHCRILTPIFQHVEFWPPFSDFFLAATKQLYEWFSPSVRLSVRPSVCLSVCHTFLTMFPSSYHHEIFRSYYQWQKWRPCKRSRSKVKVTEVTTQLNRFRTVTPVWIHIWWWNDAYSLIMLRRGALLFFKVIRQISRSHGSKNRGIWPRLGVSGL